MSRKMRAGGYIFLLYLVIFIHVLAAKTGLAGFYMNTFFSCWFYARLSPAAAVYIASHI